MALRCVALRALSRRGHVQTIWPGNMALQCVALRALSSQGRVQTIWPGNMALRLPVDHDYFSENCPLTWHALLFRYLLGRGLLVRCWLFHPRILAALLDTSSVCSSQAGSSSRRAAARQRRQRCADRATYRRRCWGKDVGLPRSGPTAGGSECFPGLGSSIWVMFPPAEEEEQCCEPWVSPQQDSLVWEPPESPCRGGDVLSGSGEQQRRLWASILQCAVAGERPESISRGQALCPPGFCSLWDSAVRSGPAAAERIVPCCHAVHPDSLHCTHCRYWAFPLGARPGQNPAPPASGWFHLLPLHTQFPPYSPDAFSPVRNVTALPSRVRHPRAGSQGRLFLILSVGDFLPVAAAALTGCWETRHKSPVWGCCAGARSSSEEQHPDDGAETLQPYRVLLWGSEEGAVLSPELQGTSQSSCGSQRPESELGATRGCDRCSSNSPNMRSGPETGAGPSPCPSRSEPRLPSARSLGGRELGS
ncbi:hypothetical protein KIL84_010975 [Mauremys mutica]|uniref:Uncharacterized protein n=1 Tax=Mauremys mutica TaxID=74926 RepID=A0A9D3XCK8_9SAUR|nr:hypothetical protein KIL84_010975 [Mauremys mutica]